MGVGVLMPAESLRASEVATRRRTSPLQLHTLATPWALHGLSTLGMWLPSTIGTEEEAS